MTKEKITTGGTLTRSSSSASSRSVGLIQIGLRALQCPTVL
jgi:hypothetical protein